MNLLLSFLKRVVLVFAFAMAGAFSTILIWALLTLPSSEPFAIQALGVASMSVGAFGPVVCWFLVRRFTRVTQAPRKHTLRITSTIGLAAILLLELLYLVALAIIHLAYHGVHM